MPHSNIKKIKTKNLVWLDITKATQANLRYLKQEFAFDSNDLNDCLPTLQRQKVHARDKYIFLILQFPIYDRETGAVDSSEIDFFIGKNFLIVIHEGELNPLIDFVHLYQTDQMIKSQLDNEIVTSVLYKLLYKLYLYCYPLLNHINSDIDKIEKAVLQQEAAKAIREILMIKRNTTNFQKTMQSHRGILQKFFELSSFSEPTHLEYTNLTSHTKDIWDYLANYKDTINALHETQESMTSLKINQIMKTLTIFSVIVFPLTLLAAIFGMNTMNSMPFVNTKLDFWYIIGIMLVGTIFMFGIFKKKKWL